jgi:predicted transcriptional regulator
VGAVVRYKYPHIISAWLSTELYMALERYAAVLKKRKSDIIREALEEYLKARGYDIDSIKRDFRRNPQRYQKPVVIL